MKANKYDLTNLTALTFIPFIGIFGTLWYVMNHGIVWQEPILLFIFWIITGLSITVGYHRLFSHRSFSAHPILEWLLAIGGAAALENSILKWCSDHRRHHKYLDTDKDPYSIKKGFFHAHIGWILQNKPDPISRVDDLKKKKAVSFQYKYYFYLFIFFGILLPVLIGLFWGRPLGALFWGVFLRITLVHHFTYAINSLCHFIGKKPYDHKCTSRDSWYVAFFTFGEGFHNFHHKFQWDYRNGIRWFHYDPSKWFIWLFSKIGLAKELKKVDTMRILKIKTINIWQEINENLDSIPEQIRDSYKMKLNDIKNKLNDLEESRKETDKVLKNLYYNKKKILLSKNIFREKNKFYKIEYASIINSLSAILLSIRMEQF